MTLRELIRSSYQERVALSPIPHDLRAALKAHERIPAFFDRLERELALLPPKFRTTTHIKECVYALTDTFTANVKRMADERQMTDAAKLAIQTAEAEKKKKDELADRLLKGESIDLSEVL